jgi:phospholipid/cholesterol/gamma-HCH transport system substrate-binding protein
MKAMLAARRRWPIWLGLAVVVIAATVGALTVLAGPGPTTATAYFPEVKGLYVGDDVDIMGVPVGKIDQITPEPGRVRVEFQYGSAYKVPANASAAIVSPTLVSTRYLQLLPAYTGGPALATGGVIPEQRTEVPVEFDQITSQLNRLAQDLGPQGANKNGALSRMIEVAAADAKGNGTRFADAVRNLSQVAQTLSDNRGNLFGTVKNLALFVSALRLSDQQIVQFNQMLSSVSTILADNQGSLASALTQLDQATGTVRHFVTSNQSALVNTAGNAAEIARLLASQSSALALVLHVAPTAAQNFYNIYSPLAASFDGTLSTANLETPAQVVCSGIASATGSSVPQAEKTCDQYLGPLLQLLAIQDPPIGVDPLARPGQEPVPGESSENTGGGGPNPLPGQPLGGAVGGGLSGLAGLLYPGGIK